MQEIVIHVLVVLLVRIVLSAIETWTIPVKAAWGAWYIIARAFPAHFHYYIWVAATY